MANVTIGFGLVLSALGLAGYFGTGAVSVTALIPLFFGVPLALLGLAARNPARTKHAMHAAAALALLGFLGAAPGLAKLPAILGGTAERPAAAAMQAAMATLLAIFIGLCVKSFRDARRARNTV